VSIFDLASRLSLQLVKIESQGFCTGSFVIILLSLAYAHVTWLHLFDPILVRPAEGFANF
jgi:hypothetical protein